MSRRSDAWPTQDLLRRGFAEQDHRASVAAAWRRFDDGLAVAICMRCGCETDVPLPAHGFHCDAGRLLDGWSPRPAAGLGRVGV